MNLDLPLHGDGDFSWYFTDGEGFNSPHKTREAAIIAGRKFFEGKAFAIFEADHALLNLRVFSGRGTAILNQIYELNKHLFDPDRDFNPVVQYEYGLQELEERLDWHFAKWLEKRCTITADVFGEVRSREEIPAAKPIDEDVIDCPICKGSGGDLIPLDEIVVRSCKACDGLGIVAKPIWGAETEAEAA